MGKTIDTKAFKPEDFILHVRPYISSDKKWTGEVEVNVITVKDNGLDNTDNESMFHLLRCMASVIPMMDQDREFMYQVEEFARDYYYHRPRKEKDTLTVTSKEGNVINVDWKPKGRA